MPKAQVQEHARINKAPGQGTTRRKWRAREIREQNASKVWRVWGNPGSYWAGVLANGAGADVMKRIATPMVGGVVTSTIMEIIVYPALFYVWRAWARGKASRH